MDAASAFDLMTRTAIVTGAHRGVGLEVSRALLAADGAVTMAVPDVAEAEPVVTQLRHQFEGCALYAAELDLTCLRSVEAFVARFNSTAQPLHLLVNADRQLPTSGPRRTADGIEVMLARNYLGHFALTMALIGALRRSAGSRVINLATSAHVLGDLDFTDPNFMHRSYDPWVAYGQSQTANLLMAGGFGQYFGADGIACHAVNPGEVAPDLLVGLPVDQVREREWDQVPGIIGPPTWTAAKAAVPVVRAALSADLDGVSGAYVEDSGQARAWPACRDPLDGTFSGYLESAMDPTRALGLWEISEELLRTAA
ncbi:MAG: oxidoreductase [Micrococcales bacterium]|nr:MAG: oxidoreductase [Micrococcales bacterium]PIE26068.1 MAG: oxidoreductase [Micrococcales bacterium]